MKLMERMKKKKMGNKGFSLVEMIIVIAIMAVLIGIVGTQVVPYLNRARVAKDMQIINSYSTAAVTAYSTKADKFDKAEKGNKTLKVLVYGGDPGSEYQFGTNQVDYKVQDFRDDIIALTGYDQAALQGAMTSAEGQNIANVLITIDFEKGTITAEAVDKDQKALDSFEVVESRISGGKTTTE